MVTVTDDDASALTIRLFGPFAVWVDGHPLPRLRSRTGKWLLALLVLRHPRELPRDLVAATLWPDSTHALALASLRNTLMDLRRALGGQGGRVCTPKPRTLCLDLDGAAVDVLAFDAAIARGDDAGREEAVALYRGPLIEECADLWAFQERQTREQACLEALETLASRAWARGDLGTAERHLRRAAATDPLRETSHRALMRVLAAAGNVSAALLVYRELRRRLRRELSAEPDPKTQALFASLDQGTTVRPRPRSSSALDDRSDRTSAAPDRRSTEPGHSLQNLPFRLTTFIGREREIAELENLLRPDTLTALPRLATVIGAGGCGKTRVALRVAERLLPEYRDGVWWVELAPLGDSALVPQTVTAVLGVPDRQNQSLTQSLSEYLRQREALLVLDNREHLLDACALLAAELLQRCPHLRLLATSREPLAIPGEMPYRLSPLSVPDPGQSLTPENLTRYDAVRLFMDRATTVRPDLQLTHETASAVARICVQLDGIPLALELAAARTRALSVEAICRHLDDRFRFLTGGGRTAAPRHRTLRALIDWSHDLLSEAERVLFRRLSVFVGGWTLEAAEQVCSECEVRSAKCEVEAPSPSLRTSNFELRTDDVLDVLTSLIDKSLVQYQEPGGEGRYQMLETVRQYGYDRLREADEVAEVRRAHRDYFLDLANRAEPELRGGDQRRWMARLGREVDNLRAALDWSREQNDTDAGLRQLMALWRFWGNRGYYREVRERLAILLADASVTTPEKAQSRGMALLIAGPLMWLQGDPRAGRSCVEESLSIAERIHDDRLRAWSLLNLGSLAMFEGDYCLSRSRHTEALTFGREQADFGITTQALMSLGITAVFQAQFPQARAYVEEALILSKERSDTRQIAFGLAKLGEIACEEGDLTSARAHLDEGLRMAQGIDYQRGVSHSLHTLGRIALKLGDLEAAQQCLNRSLSLDQDQGDRERIVWSLRVLGEVAQARSDWEAARASYEESLTEFRAIGHRWGIAWGLERMAGLAMARGEAARAAPLFAAAARLRESIGAPVPPIERAGIDEAVAAARAALGDTAFAVAWAAGHALPMEEAIECALARDE